ISGVVEEPSSPSLCSSLPLLTPGKPRSTMKAENASPSTLAKTMKRSAKPPLVIHIFSPLRTKLPSACFVALARAPSASDPEPDSLSAYAPTISPETSPGRYFCFCSSVPKHRIGVIASPVCAPNGVAKDADRPTASPTTSEDTLPRSSPPHSSSPDDSGAPVVQMEPAVLIGDVGGEQAQSARALHQLARERPVFRL